VTDANTIKLKITTLSRSIETACAAMDKDTDINLSGVETAVEEICNEMASLTPEEGESLKDSLILLTDNIDKMERKLKAVQEGLSTEIANVTARQRATNAYGKPPPPKNE